MNRTISLRDEIIYLGNDFIQMPATNPSPDAPFVPLHDDPPTPLQDIPPRPIEDTPPLPLQDTPPRFEAESMSQNGSDPVQRDAFNDGSADA